MAGLYIHIPYCHSKCAYCDFYSRPDDGKVEQVINALVGEWNCRRNEVAASFNTIYIGGGTPSSINPRLLEQLINKIARDITPIEFTIEVNPEDVNDTSAKQWLSLGINRISMGVQSLIDSELRAVGRRHTATDALNAIDCLHKAGFVNISCDLIYGLPGQTLKSWNHNVDTLLSKDIPHLSAYSLSYEPGTRLYASMICGKIQPTDDNVIVEMYNSLIEKTCLDGMHHYEISNFARPGFEAVHNSSYWQSVPYVGLGPSAHSFDGVLRRINPASINEYLKAVPSFQIEDESDIDRVNDIIITRLRTDKGLDLTIDIPPELQPRLLKQADRWIKSGKLIHSDQRLIIDQADWIIADAILRDLLLD